LKREADVFPRSEAAVADIEQRRLWGGTTKQKLEHRTLLPVPMKGDGKPSSSVGFPEIVRLALIVLLAP